jgi:hypothetical protein
MVILYQGFTDAYECNEWTSNEYAPIRSNNLGFVYTKEYVVREETLKRRTEKRNAKIYQKGCLSYLLVFGVLPKNT